MFTIPTIPKLLLLVVVIGVVWWWYRRAQVRGRADDGQLNRSARPTKARGRGGATVKPVEDMAQCRVCNAYVAAKGAARCGRDNCPF